MGHIMWLGMAGVHTGFHTITLVLYIGSLPNLATWFLCGRGRTLFILGSLGQGHRYYKYNFWQRSFPHDNFSSVYWIFNKLGHMIPLWKGKNPIYFGVIRSRSLLLYMNFWQQGRFHMITLVLYIGSLPNLTTWLPCGRGRILFILGSLGQRSRVTINIIFDNRVISAR